MILLIAQALGILLFTPALLALFQAVRNRMDNFRPGLVGLCIAGPLFFAGSLIASYFAIDAAAGLFDPAVDLDPGVALDSEDADDVAQDIYLDQSSANVASGLRFAGQLGLTFIIVYTALYAMRAGLMTRFWGTLSMALGVGVLLIGPPALLGFFLAISLMVAGFWPGGLPPAWAEGKAMPWPKPGEAPPPSDDDGEELASPEDFEGTATEVEADGRAAGPPRQQAQAQAQAAVGAVAQHRGAAMSATTNDLGASPTVVRAVLGVLGGIQLIDGLYALFAPRSFFDDFPLGRGWVEALPAFNEHLVRDVGSLFLATAVVLFAAAWFLERRLTLIALVAFLTFSIPHFVYHSFNLGPYSTGDAIGNFVGLLLTVVAPLALLVVMLRAGAGERQRGAAERR